MKKINFIFPGIILITGAINSNAATLKVAIDHVNSDNGTLLAQVFAGQDNYNNGVPKDNVMVPAKTGKALLTFDNLEPGEYAVRLVHDENNNQKMDSNAFGLPTEGYAFSNEAVGNMGPPKYQDMVIVISKQDTEVTTNAKMTYLME